MGKLAAGTLFLMPVPGDEINAMLMLIGHLNAPPGMGHIIYAPLRMTP
jgi:hypothetical protein